MEKGEGEWESSGQYTRDLQLTRNQQRHLGKAASEVEKNMEGKVS